MKQLVRLLDANFNSGHGWQPGVSLSAIPKLVQWYRPRAEHFVGLTVLTDYKLTTPCQARWKVAWLVESPDIAPEIYDPSRVDFTKFHRVITFHRGLLNSLPNAVEGLMGGCHIHEPDIHQHAKSKLVSMIASSKDSTSGHKFRCSVANRLQGSVDLFGRGRARPLVNKIDGLKDYAFSVVVENCRVPDYFSEKLIDCFLTGTVPIYSGAPVGRWFNSDGVLKFDTEEEADKIVASMTTDKYLKMLPAVTDNFQRAQRFICPEDEMQRLGYFNP